MSPFLFWVLTIAAFIVALYLFIRDWNNYLSYGYLGMTMFYIMGIIIFFWMVRLGAFQ